MKFLVVSDNHGDQKILEKLVHHYQNKVEALIHCGDSELSFDADLRRQFLIVGGNMDFDQQFPASLTQKIGAETIFVAHGHRLGINYDLTKMQLAAQQAGATLAFYGHSHQLACEMAAGCLFLNPGSISQPRGHWAILGGTYAIVTTTPEKIAVQYYTRDLTPVSDLQFEFNR
jgi:phosphoesterase, MJ0936 family